MPKSQQDHLKELFRQLEDLQKVQKRLAKLVSALKKNSAPKQ